MSQTSIRRLAGVLVAALVVWGALAASTRLREDRASRFTLARVDTASIDTIALERRGDTAVLTRAPHGWMVNGHAADSAHTHDLLTGLADTADWGELIAERPSSYARLGVDADSGRHVRVVGHGRQLLEFTSGKRTADWSGVYLRRGGDSAVYGLHSGPLGELLTFTADDWRDKRIARVVPESVATAEIQRGGRRVSLRRAGTRWTFGGSPADSSAVATTLGLYRTLDASGFANAAQADSLRGAKPVATVHLRSKTGALLLGLAFDSTAGGAWARADSGGPVFKVDPYQLAHLAPPESTLSVKKTKTKTSKK